MRILITGATGFVGQHFLEDMAGEDVAIRIISRNRHPEFRIMLRNTETVQADISDRAALEKAMQGVDVVVNLAGEIRQVQKFRTTNINGASHLAELSRQKGIGRFVHLSSVGVVGLQHSLSRTVVTEATACLPANDYERSKLEAERLLISSLCSPENGLVILRPTNIFGDHHPRRVLLGLLRRVNRRGRLVCRSKAVVNYVYVKDVTYVIRHFIFHKAEDQIYNVGSPMPFSLFHDAAASAMNKRPFRTILPRFFFSAGLSLHYPVHDQIKNAFRALSNGVEYDDGRLRRILTYRYGMEEGLHRTVANYRSKGLL